MLVTQNIDDLHTKAMPGEPRNGKIEGTSDYAFTDGVIDLHGNTRYMRCPTFCSEIWLNAPSRAQVAAAGGELPRCLQCQKIMKPHSMCFDEQYNEIFYQS